MRLQSTQPCSGLAARVRPGRPRRWLNDKLLRDMAGTLTARDMVRGTAGLAAALWPAPHLSNEALSVHSKNPGAAGFTLLQEALFKPVPFGETGHASIFSRAVAPEHVQLWDLFRSVDMDKESRVLQVRRAYAASGQGETWVGALLGSLEQWPMVAACMALAAWALEPVYL